LAATNGHLKQQIISHSADLSAVLRFLNGDYVLPTSYRVTYWGMAALFGGLALEFGRDLASWTPQSGDDRSALLVVVAIMAAFAAVFAIRASTTYSFSQEAIRRNGPLRLWRKQLLTAEIAEGWLHLDRGVALELRSRDGRRLAIPLEAQLRADLAKLYPEVGLDPQFTSPALSSRLRAIIWTALAVLVAAVVIVTVVLVVSGGHR
jgi:hypothetical protein